MAPLYLFCYLAVGYCCLDGGVSSLKTSDSGLRVGSFNIQVFGQTKFSKNWVVQVLCKIVLRYDIILIMEIRDRHQKVIPGFLEKINRFAGGGITYDAVISKRLGRTSNKEQYAYLYRTGHVKVLKTYQYKDEEDKFEREPFGVLVKATDKTIPSFFMLGIHSRPDDVVSELNLLDDVYREASLYFGTSSAIILGDFNADCSYLSKSDFKDLDMVKDDSFVWLIDDYQDTTTKDTACAYDRIVLAGDLVKYVPRNQVEVFKYDEAYDLTYQQSVEVSDHYPLGMLVRNREVSEEEHVVQYEDRYRLMKEAEVTGGHIAVAAFNVRIFGMSKLASEEVMEILSQIVCRYDIILIQEIRDSSGEAIVALLERVNQEANFEGVSYSMVISERLGRSTSKEQYTYMYRTNTVEILDTLQYDDSKLDAFEREPFSVLVKSLKLDIPEVILIGLHTKPSDVESELNQLVDVYEDAVRHFGTTSSIVLGDLNADCSYLPRKKLAKLLSSTDSHFDWLIKSNMDTTTTSTNCAYDRFLAAGPITGYVARNSVGVFQYDLAYSLSREEAEAVSDHYPIELLLQETCLSEVCKNSPHVKHEL